ncbi:MAG: ATP phosphoribosyltransferase [Nanoarchaeota archaeon]|nr:ATP phosphoribosyltransferase [Nanoarchaeota archaeon]
MQKIRIALPKGRLWESTVTILQKAGMILEWKEKGYRPKSNMVDIDFFIVKPRNIPKLVESGLVDMGIVGADLVQDEQASVKFLLDLKALPVYVCVAGKRRVDKKRLVVATEYESIARQYFAEKNIPISILKTYGSTECFVPAFADVIVDHVQTGTALLENGLRVYDIIMKSTTQLIAHTNLSSGKQRRILLVRDLLADALNDLSFIYPEFLSEKQIRNNDLKRSYDHS